MIDTLPFHRGQFVGLTHHADAWFLGAERGLRENELEVFLQRRPCSGKIPGHEDVYTKYLGVPPSQSRPLSDWMADLSGGNPGASEVLEQLRLHLQAHERRLTMEAAVVWLLGNDISGPALWRLYKDHHNKRIVPVAKHLARGWMNQPLPYSPSNFLISPHLGRDEVQRDPLYRYTDPSPEAESV